MVVSVMIFGVRGFGGQNPLYNYLEQHATQNYRGNEKAQTLVFTQHCFWFQT
jgi:hypothetical protein